MGQVLQLTGLTVKSKKELRGKELVAWYVTNSECLVTVVPGEQHPKSVYIEFHGAAASIPSLKNSKLPGKNFMLPETQARLKSMDILFRDELFKQRLETPYFGKMQLHVLVVHGKRKVTFDGDNPKQTVRDWLEPSEKQKGGKRKNRGWGIGLVDDDRTVTCYGLHSWQTGAEHQHTAIFIRPWEAVREKAIELVQAHFI